MFSSTCCYRLQLFKFPYSCMYAGKIILKRACSWLWKCGLKSQCQTSVFMIMDVLQPRATFYSRSALETCSTFLGEVRIECTMKSLYHTASITYIFNVCIYWPFPRMYSSLGGLSKRCTDLVRNFSVRFKHGTPGGKVHFSALGRIQISVAMWTLLSTWWCKHNDVSIRSDCQQTTNRRT